MNNTPILLLFTTFVGTILLAFSMATSKGSGARKFTKCALERLVYLCFGILIMSKFSPLWLSIAAVLITVTGLGNDESKWLNAKVSNIFRRVFQQLQGKQQQ